MTFSLHDYNLASTTAKIKVELKTYSKKKVFKIFGFVNKLEFLFYY